MSETKQVFLHQGRFVRILRFKYVNALIRYEDDRSERWVTVDELQVGDFVPNDLRSTKEGIWFKHPDLPEDRPEILFHPQEIESLRDFCNRWLMEHGPKDSLEAKGYSRNNAPGFSPELHVIKIGVASVAPNKTCMVFEPNDFTGLRSAMDEWDAKYGSPASDVDKAKADNFDLLWDLSEGMARKALDISETVVLRFSHKDDGGFRMEMNPHAGTVPNGPDEKVHRLMDAARALVIGIEDKSDGPLDGLTANVKSALAALYEDVPEWSASDAESTGLASKVRTVLSESMNDAMRRLDRAARSTSSYQSAAMSQVLEQSNQLLKKYAEYSFEDHYAAVKSLMERAGNPCPDKPTIPDLQWRKLRAKLQIEEALEKCAALAVNPIVQIAQPGLHNLHEYEIDFVDDGERSPDLVKIIDAVMDNRVISTGTLVACGVKEGEFQKLVDESNLAKFEIGCPQCGCGNPGALRQGHIVRVAECGPNVFSCSACGKLFEGPHRREDGKWVKGEGWKAPDIQGELGKQILKYDPAIEPADRGE
jgi:predicted HAD superfamily Cof-like phosphohydrolase